MTPPMTEPAEITQADREAAASLGRLQSRLTRRDATDLLDGNWDAWSDCQAFARHRIASTTALAAENEWLRAAIPGIWRCAVSDVICAIDAVRPRRHLKGKALQDACADLDRALQIIHDERMNHAPFSYEQAFEAGKSLRAALAKGSSHGG